MKNKWLIIAIVVVLILFIAIGAYKMLSSKAKPQTQTTTEQSAKPQNPSTVKGSILSLLTGGKTQSCTITYPNNQGTGTVFVADKKFAGEFTVKDTSGKETTGHSISDGTYVYVWSSTMSTGIKMKLDEATNAAQNAQTQTFSLNQNVDLKCGPWIADNSKFTVPSNIQFQDMSNLLQQVAPKATVAPQTGTGPKINPSVCDQITDPTAKAACENALKGQ